MANNADIEWAEYTGDRAPFRSDNTIYCAWHSHHALFLDPDQALGVVGMTQLQSTDAEATKKALWQQAENELGGSIVPRAHIMNFRKV